MTLVQLAGALPRDPEFREWLDSRFPSEWTEAMAANFIRVQCSLTSRRELATDTEAQARFHNLIRRPFLVWREAAPTCIGAEHGDRPKDCALSGMHEGDRNTMHARRMPESPPGDCQCA